MTIIIETTTTTRERLVLVPGGTCTDYEDKPGRVRLVTTDARDATPADLERAGWVLREVPSAAAQPAPGTLAHLRNDLRDAVNERDELRHHYDAAGPEHNLLALLDSYESDADTARAEASAAYAMVVAAIGSVGAETIEAAVARLVADRGALLARAEKAERELAEVSRAASGGMTVREAARARCALGGPDAQALEGALSATERERDEARRLHSAAEAQVACRNELRAQVAAAEGRLRVAEAERLALRAELERLTAPGEGSEGEPRIVPGSANHLEAWNAIAAFVESGGGTSSSVATQKAVVRVEDAFRRLVAFGVAHERARQQPPHDPGCDTLEVGPNLGPSTKPCNCRKQPAKDRATDEELVEVARTAYDWGRLGDVPWVDRIALAVAAHARQECLVAQAVAANVDIRVAEDDRGGFMVGAHARGRDEELERAVLSSDVPATLARLLGEVSRG